MIIAKGGDGKGRDILFLGLSRKNIERMLADQPILVSETTNAPKGVLPPGTEIFIFAGETELEMLEQFKRRGVVTSNTQVNIDPRLQT